MNHSKSRGPGCARHTSGRAYHEITGSTSRAEDAREMGAGTQSAPDSRGAVALHARSLAPLVKTRGFGMTPSGIALPATHGHCRALPPKALHRNGREERPRRSQRTSSPPERRFSVLQTSRNVTQNAAFGMRYAVGSGCAEGDGAAREIPRPVGENAGLRDDALYEPWNRALRVRTKTTPRARTTAGGFLTSLLVGHDNEKFFSHCGTNLSGTNLTDL
jgi:hypothetical protein